MSKNIKAFRSSILHFIEDPAKVNDIEESYEYFADGLMIVKNGLVEQLGNAEDLLPLLPTDIEVTHYKDSLITPGFLDTHIHYSQMEIIGAYGEQLLEWLDTYTFPAERKFSDPEVSRKSAEFFFDELLKNGTTTALVFGTVHPESIDEFFKVRSS